MNVFALIMSIKNPVGEMFIITAVLNSRKEHCLTMITPGFSNLLTDMSP